MDAADFHATLYYAQLEGTGVWWDCRWVMFAELDVGGAREAVDRVVNKVGKG